MTDQEMLDLLKPGQSVRINYGKGHPASRLLHIRAIVDDHQFVYREWSRHKNRWIYSVDSINLFAVANRFGMLEAA